MQSLSSDFQECDRVFHFPDSTLGVIVEIVMPARAASPYFGCPTPGSNTNGCVSVKGEGLPP